MSGTVLNATVPDVPCLVWRNGRSARLTPGARTIAVETPVALTYDGSTYAVMMATPADLEDFALGFSLAEGVIASPQEIRSIEIVALAEGVEARMWLADGIGQALADRRRQLAGPTGCGLCGVESLAEAARPTPMILADGARYDTRDIGRAVAALRPHQRLHRETGAMHAAAFWTRDEGLVLLREDVGRHNALDKVAGALARAGRVAGQGAVLLTSRVSVEMVQKTARIGAPLLVAVSASTALAIRTADEAGVTLVTLARDDGFEVFTHPERIAPGREIVGAADSAGRRLTRSFRRSDRSDPRIAPRR